MVHCPSCRQQEHEREVPGRRARQYSLTAHLLQCPPQARSGRTRVQSERPHRTLPRERHLLSSGTADLAVGRLHLASPVLHAGTCWIQRVSSRTQQWTVVVVQMCWAILQSWSNPVLPRTSVTASRGQPGTPYPTLDAGLGSNK